MSNVALLIKPEFSFQNPNLESIRHGPKAKSSQSSRENFKSLIISNVALLIIKKLIYDAYSLRYKFHYQRQIVYVIKYIFNSETNLAFFNSFQKIERENFRKLGLHWLK